MRASTNLQVRVALYANGITQYQLAERLGKNPSTFCRHLKTELSPDAQAELIDMVHQMARNGGVRSESICQ